MKITSNLVINWCYLWEVSQRISTTISLTIYYWNYYDYSDISNENRKYNHYLTCLTSNSPF